MKTFTKHTLIALISLMCSTIGLKAQDEYLDWPGGTIEIDGPATYCSDDLPDTLLIKGHPPLVPGTDEPYRGLEYEWRSSSTNDNFNTPIAFTEGLNITFPSTTTTYRRYTKYPNSYDPPMTYIYSEPIDTTIIINNPSIELDSLNTNFTTICKGDTVKLTIYGGELEQEAYWALFDEDPTSGIALSIDTTSQRNTFTVLPEDSTTYYVRYENSTPPCNTIGNTKQVTILVNQPSQANKTDEICSNEEYTYPNGEQANTSSPGNQAPHQSIIKGGATNGCDSIIITTLTVLPNEYDNEDDVVCQSRIYYYPDGASANTSTPGTKTHTSKIIGGASNGCDLYITTTLTVLPNEYDNEDDVVC